MKLVHSLNCYVEELPDYGIDAFLDAWATAGVSRLRPTLSYHVCRLLSPANPRRRLLDLEGDVCFLPGSAAEYFEGPLKPRFSVRSAGVLDELAQVAPRHGIALDGWAVFLNNWTLATEHPECAVQSPLGCPDRTWLTPAHPAVVDYCVSLVRAIGAAGLVDVLECEAVYHVPFPCHPAERFNVSGTLGDLDSWLCGVCVGEHSLRLIEEVGGDGERTAALLRHHLDQRLLGAGAELPKSPAGLHDLLGDDAEPLLQGRALATTRLLRAMAAEAARHGLRLEWEEDLSSWESFFSGIQEGPLSSQRQWEVGVDRAEIRDIVDEVGLLLYFADEQRFQAELADAIATFGKVPRVLHRPYPPDVQDIDALARRLAILQDAGVPESVLYMQSLMPADGPQRLERARALLGADA